MGYDRPRTYSFFYQMGATVSPVDATSYYIPPIVVLGWGGTEAIRRLSIPKDGHIRVVRIWLYASTVAGSNEAWVFNIRVNDTTNYPIASVSLNTAERIWSNSDMNIPVKAGDFIHIYTTTPTWVTNPTDVFGYATIIVDTA
jgi:hypothetical protein